MKLWIKSIFIISILCILFNLCIFGLTRIYAQKGAEGYKTTGYFVKVESLSIPLDITQNPIGVFIVYTKSGNTEIWRENVKLDTYTTDEQLEKKICEWACPYIGSYERKEALELLASTSKIVGKKIDHLVKE